MDCETHAGRTEQEAPQASDGRILAGVWGQAEDGIEER